MMAISLSVILGLCACALLLPSLSDLVSLSRIASVAAQTDNDCKQAATPAFPRASAQRGKADRSCLQSLTVLRYERFTVCVVADNCTDRTPAWCAQLASGVSSEKIRCDQANLTPSPGPWIDFPFTTSTLSDS